jgi:uncharacterized membrane protein YfcA
VGTGTATFAFSKKITQWAGPQTDGEYSSVQHALVAATAVYGSYFGASFAVLLLALLSLTASGYRDLNVVKNLLAGLIGIVAIVIFTIQSLIAQEPIIAVVPTGLLTLGAIAGGYLGAWIARILPVRLMKPAVILFGTYWTVEYARKYWFT